MRCEEKWTGFLANNGTNLKGSDKWVPCCHLSVWEQKGGTQAVW